MGSGVDIVAFFVVDRWPTGSVGDAAGSNRATLEFLLNPTLKEHFVQCFRMARTQRRGVGFALV